MQMSSNKRNKQTKEEGCMFGLGGRNAETEESNASSHSEEKRQLIYGKNYGMTVKSFTDI